MRAVRVLCPACAASASWVAADSALGLGASLRVPLTPFVAARRSPAPSEMGATFSTNNLNDNRHPVQYKGSGYSGTWNSLINSSARAAMPPLMYVPGRQHPPVFGYSDRITPMLCKSIASALRSGYDYQLLGVGRKKLLNHPDPKLEKLAYYMHVAQTLPVEAHAIFVDTFDVLFQRDASEFATDLEALLYGAPPPGLLFLAEPGCYPFMHPHPTIYSCERTQGSQYMEARWHGQSAKWLAENSTIGAPFGCQMQRKCDTQTVHSTLLKRLLDIPVWMWRFL